MKTSRHSLFLSLALFAGRHQAAAQGTAFTYQGQLQNNGSPANGTYNLTFALFNTNTTGTASAGPVTNDAVSVTDGLFTVLINFGPGVFTVRTMLSLEPATVTDRRYPLLFQQGETALGVPIVNGQHPHEFIMELAVLYDLKVGKNSLLSFYFAP